MASELLGKKWSEGVANFVLKVYCCREWEVSLLSPEWGKCGMCHERPTRQRWLDERSRR